MAFDAYMKIAGPTLDGEATAKGMEKQIEINSFSWVATHPTAVGSAGAFGGSTGRVVLQDIKCTKHVDSASSKLFSACCTGQIYENVVITMRKATGTGGEQKPYLKYYLSMVIVDSIGWSGSTDGDDTLNESVSLAYTKITVEYLKQDTKTGSMTSVGTASWDRSLVSR